MLELFPQKTDGSPLEVLLLGAHSDDIEIGCGGTVLRLLESGQDLVWRWVVFGADEPEREREARESAERLLAGAENKSVAVERFRSSFFPYQGEPIKEAFERLKAVSTPDVVFTHYRHDLHQDHRLLCELTWNTFRGHLVLEYEIPKYDGDLGNPNVFVPLDETIVERKVEHLMRFFGTQRSRHWFRAETFRGLMRIRGLECATQYAEAFHGRKVALGIPAGEAPPHT